IIGLTNLISYDNVSLTKTNHLDLSVLLNYPNSNQKIDFHQKVHGNGNILEDVLLNDESFINAINNHDDIIKQISIANTDRCVGARISGFITKQHGQNGFNGNLQINFSGAAGQSFGAFISKGMYLNLVGEANDYVGKGMNGGEIIITPPLIYRDNASDYVLLGNTCLYGSTGGYLFAQGQAGERFAVRNSAGQAVVEGVGDHACEYMTGGLIVVLGISGRNIGAGMTGGIAYFLDEDQQFLSKVNMEIVQVQRIVTKEAEDQLKNMIEFYEIKTKSIKARRILDNWSNYINRFWQIVPPSEQNSPLTNIEYSSRNNLIQ
ncbi:MAG: glutamate synthase subunit alpha, partial [Symploca sp. SIO3E6]|nr:glutamate synthase subunit alpha [Caldora sp. SIO3E6]